MDDGRKECVRYFYFEVMERLECRKCTGANIRDRYCIEKLLQIINPACVKPPNSSNSIPKMVNEQNTEHKQNGEALAAYVCLQEVLRVLRDNSVKKIDDICCDDPFLIYDELNGCKLSKFTSKIDKTLSLSLQLLIVGIEASKILVNSENHSQKFDKNHLEMIGEIISFCILAVSQNLGQQVRYLLQEEISDSNELGYHQLFLPVNFSYEDSEQLIQELFSDFNYEFIE
ncbi:MAG: hypothetical protein MHMPM18_000530 [Marteilia pararefringens]